MKKLELRAAEIMALVPELAKGRLIEEMIGGTCYTFTDPGDFLQVSTKHQPAAVFLHRDFCGSSRGLSFLPSLLNTYPETPILMLVPTGDYATMVQALALGAADVVPSPLVKEEVLSRLHRRVADTRTHSASRDQRSCGDIRLITALRQVICGVRMRQLAPVPYSLLECLIQNYPRTAERSELIIYAWKGRTVSANSLDQQIQQVRVGLAEVGSSLHLKSVYGVGFQLIHQPQPDASHGDKGKR